MQWKTLLLLTGFFVLATGRTTLADVSIVTNDSKGQASADINERLNRLTGQNQTLFNAREAFNSKKLQECEKLIEKAKLSVLDLPAADLVIARWMVDSNQLGAAIARIENYIVKKPDDAEAYLFLAEVAFRSGRWTDAWAMLQMVEPLISRSVSLTPKTPEEDRANFLYLDLLRLQGEVAASRQDLATSKAIFQRMSELQPNAGYPKWALGRLSLIQGDTPAALKQFTTARKLDAKLPQPELTIAIALGASVATIAESEKWFRNGLKADTATAVNWVEYSKWLILQDRPQEVIEISDKLKPEWTTVRDEKVLLGLAHRYLENWNKAEAIFKDLHQQNADDIESGNHLALVLVEQLDEGKRARAKQISDGNLGRAPNVETIVATAAWIEFKLGSIDVADKMLGQLAASTVITPQTAYYVSQVLDARNKREEAATVLKSALNAPGFWPQRRAAITKINGSKVEVSPNAANPNAANPNAANPSDAVTSPPADSQK
ncbi:MAG: tetratricopeptide repeat protein [Planctomycetota bacterium]|nr:tetratricopeptide repeat protein [Planctomycetota bacterium]